MRRLCFVFVLGAAGCSSILGFDSPVLVTADGGADASWPTVTVIKDDSSTGTGIVTSNIGDLDCGVACDMASSSGIDPGTNVTLTATAGPGSLFLGWSGPCSGIVRTCTVTVGNPTTVTARFDTNPYNVIFITAETMHGNFGGVAIADEKCVEAAASAGLSGAFLAFVSEPENNARDWLVIPGSDPPVQPRGFVRMDGLPIADTVADLVAGHRVWYPITYDVNGVSRLRGNLEESMVYTGSNPDGTVAVDTCNGWSTDSNDVTSVSGQWGDIGGAWTMFSAFAYSCGDRPKALLCVQVNQSNELPPPAPTPGKKIWITRAGFTPGGGRAAADALCATELPAGVTSAVALLPTTSDPASDRVQTGTLYVRPDGIPVGTGAELIANAVRTGVWVHADGTYDHDPDPWTPFVWLGAPSFGALATAEINCVNWTSNAPTATGMMEYPAATIPWFGSRFGDSTPNATCDAPHLLYCVEP
jgi:hypothetical protein